jgi:hypothetical protein
MRNDPLRLTRPHRGGIRRGVFAAVPSATSLARMNAMAMQGQVLAPNVAAPLTYAAG